MAFRFIRPKSRVIIRKSEDSMKILERLNQYLESASGEPMRFLVRFWNAQGEALTYGELRSIITDEDVPEEIMDTWFQDYSHMLSKRVTPVWEEAIRTGYTSDRRYGEIDPAQLITSEEKIREWILSRTAELVTECCDTQREAIRYLVAEGKSIQMTPVELARYIRPTIGLTKPQAAANLRYYQSVKEQMKKDHPRMTPESIERKSKSLAAKYAEKQHRSRAEMIAQTEIAKAYNEGNDLFIRDAVNQGLMPRMKKVWLTANTDACQTCKSLEGSSVELDGEFSGISGRRTYEITLPPAHPRCRCAVKYVEVRDKNGKPIWEDFVANESIDGIIESGGRITNIFSQEADDFAKMYYKEIRSFSTDVKKIAENLGRDVSDIRKIKAYLFEDESYYDADKGIYRRFDPDCAIAQSWQRLMVGKDIKPHDRTLIEHELLEMKIKLENPGIEHFMAHKLASKKYDYGKEAEEYYGNLKKYRKDGS